MCIPTVIWHFQRNLDIVLCFWYVVDSLRKFVFLTLNDLPFFVPSSSSCCSWDDCPCRALGSSARLTSNFGILLVKSRFRFLLTWCIQLLYTLFSVHEFLFRYLQNFTQQETQIIQEIALEMSTRCYFENGEFCRGVSFLADKNKL